MGKWEKIDFKFSADGDLVIEQGDFALVRGQEFIIQSARNRVRTSDPEWYDPILEHIGANLEDLRGMPNTPNTAALGMEKIGEVITKDGLIDVDDIYMDVVPFDKETIVYFLFINSPYQSDPVGFEIRMNLNTGVTVRGV